MSQPNQLPSDGPGPATRQVVLCLSSDRNADLLRSLLTGEEVTAVEATQPLPAFDVCVVDGRSLPAVAEELQGMKAAADPVYLPVLLLVDSRAGQRVGDELAAVVDEVVTMPTTEPIIRGRIDALLRARRQSLELADQREQLALYRRAMDDATTSITVADADGDQPLTYANDAFLAMTGYDRESVLGRNCRFLQGEDTDPETVRTLREAIDAGAPVEVEVLNYRKDETPFWNHLRVTPVFDDGELVSFLGFQRDVTERKERARERDRLIELLDQTQDIAEVGGWEIDPETGSVEFTEGLSRLLGVDPQTSFELDEAFGFYHPDDEAAARETFASILTDWEPKTLECRVVTADGEERWVHVRGVPTSYGEEVVVRGTVQDITARKRRELSLERYELIVEAASDPIYTLDDALEFTLLNSAGQEFTGTGAEELLGEHVSVGFGDDHAEALGNAITLLLSREVDQTTIETTCVNAAGEERVFQTTISVMPTGDGERFRGVVCVSRDITRLLENEGRLSVLDRVLRHNLRNKMNVIVGQLAQIREEADDPGVDRAISRVELASEELLGLSETARKFKAIIDASGRQVLAPTDVTEAVQSAIAEVGASHPDADVTVDAPAEAWAVCHQSFGLGVGELLENAIEHGGDDVRVAVERDDAQGTVVVSVADDGPGLSDVDKRALQSGVESPLQHTMGLGLWFVRWMATNSGGSLLIRDNEPRGTVVEVHLPAADPGRPPE